MRVGITPINQIIILKNPNSRTSVPTRRFLPTIDHFTTNSALQAGSCVFARGLGRREGGGGKNEAR
jgi:hypothetical protein